MKKATTRRGGPTPLRRMLEQIDGDMLAAALAGVAEPPRIHGQRGALSCNRNRWVLRWREPRDAEGKRRQRSFPIGTLEQFPTRPAARAQADRVLAALVDLVASQRDGENS